MASMSTCAFSISCCSHRAAPGRGPRPIHSSSTSVFKPSLKEHAQPSLRAQVAETIKMASGTLAQVVADAMFKYVPVKYQGNFEPVDEIGEAVAIEVSEGQVPEDFPQGVYIRNGPNPYQPDKTSATSPLGEIASCWFEGDGMLHATYFHKSGHGDWSLAYKNRYMESKTFLMEKRKEGTFLPGALGHPAAVFLANVLNQVRYGNGAKYTNNTNVFEHAGRVYAIAENHLPHEVDPNSLETLRVWDLNGSWGRPFTSHPKRAPGSGELVIMGVDLKKPYNVIGVISADGSKVVHKADLKFKSCFLSHELGVTQHFNILMDYPLEFGVERLLKDKQLLGYEEEASDCRIGVMPRYGNAEDIKWFKVKSHCSFHIINTFEDGDEVVVRGCRTSGSILFGPHHRANKAEWYKRAYTPLPSPEEAEGFDPSVDGALFALPYEWRLNLATGEAAERFLTSPENAMDFPTMDSGLVGVKNEYAYVQVVDSVRSGNAGMPIFNKFAKLHFNEKDNEVPTKLEFHELEENHFCSGLQFVKKPEGTDEDDGWVVSYVHDEDSNQSKVYIIDAKKFTEGPVAKIDLPYRVPYGFHAAFIYQ